MTPSFEIALAIGLIVGFALGYGFARSFPIDVIRQRGDGTFSNPGTLAV